MLFRTDKVSCGMHKKVVFVIQSFCHNFLLKACCVIELLTAIEIIDQWSGETDVLLKTYYPKSSFTL